MAQATRKRADGEASRERILDAAAQIAGERGFQGTSISLVSERSGLPASSIYWHFANKDELIAAVIDRSFGRWAAALDRPIGAPADARGDDLFHHLIRRVGETLDAFPDFLRLGLMLILDRSPDEPTARAKFLEGRAITADRTRQLYRALFDDLTDDQIAQLATLTIVLADGTFIAHDADGLDVRAGYDLMATALLGTVASFRVGR